MYQSGQSCQALAVRLPQPDVDGLAGAVERIGTETRSGRLWVQHVPAAADSTAAAGWRSRELHRPLGQPGDGPPYRAVLLVYADGPADLVLVTYRTRRDTLGPLLAAVLSGTGLPADAVPAAGPEPTPPDGPGDPAVVPDWGLGDPAAPPDPCPVPVDLRLPADTGPVDTGPADTGEARILSALGLVLAHHCGVDRVRLGWSGAAEPLTLVVDPDRRTGDYLDLVAAAVARGAGPDAGASPSAGGGPPLAGLVVGRPPDPWLRSGPAFRPLAFRPFLVPPYPLTVEVSDDDSGRRVVTFWYQPRYLDRAVAERFARLVRTAYQQLGVTGADVPVGAVSLLDAADRDEILRLGGVGCRPPAWPGRRTPGRIDEMVAARAAAHPDRVAVRCQGDELTYGELDRRADRMAAGLRALGLAPGALVGVCLQRSPELVVTLLAVLRAGAAYLPLDPNHPVERLAYMVDDAGADVVVSTPDTFPQRPGVRLVRPGELTAVAPAPVGSAGCATAGGPEAPAYVIYTSGSTGRPKGVVVPHRNVVSLLAATREEFDLGPEDTWSLFHSAAFDFSVWEIWGCLLTGGRLVVVPYWVSRSPEEFAALLVAEQVTVLSQTPSAFGQLAAVDERNPMGRVPRLVVFGGEPLDTRPLLDWFDRHPEWECRLVNMYGITETTVHVTAEPVRREAALAGSRSVGRPLPGWSVYVLDPRGRLLPPGVAGEIHVGGAGVAVGYLRRPELTEERFVADPYGGGRMYRSGDRGRLLPDGRLEHLGRLDSQVKIRGHRIELGEIRARLLDAPEVASAAVLLRQHPHDPARTRLDGYVVFRGQGGDTGEVRRHVARFLPDYMVPSTVTALPALPLTANGKVDHDRLPDPTSTGPGTDGEPDPDPVRAAWESVFGVRVRTDDNFFSLGGNSLLAVRLVAALRARGLPPIELRDIYRNPTVTGVTRVLAVATERGDTP